MNLSQIKTTLREIGVSPVRSLGQNFLHDRNLARWIVEQADVQTNDTVVEVGPGLGALTELLLDKGARVLALEKDGRLAQFLEKKFPASALEISHMDALNFDVQKLYAAPRVKFVGNLPYYVSSQLLLKFLHWPSPISLWLCMLQKEMAARLSARPGTKDYGALTLQIQLHYRVEYLRKIPASVFIPRPEVDSAMVRLRPRRGGELPACDAELFFRLVRAGFAQRRKQLGKLLRAEISDWPEAAAALEFPVQARAEELSLAQWIALTNHVRPVAPAEGPGMAEEQFPVVDAEDRVLGEAPRGKVHGDNLRHRAVHILIFNRAGQVFLQKRSRCKDRHPEAWDSSAAGHVSAGEEYDAAASRELDEELGLQTPLSRVVKLPASERTGQEFIWLYRGQAEGPFSFNKTEIEAGEFFPPPLLDAWLQARPDDFAPGFTECWKACRDRASG